MLAAAARGAALRATPDPGASGGTPGLDRRQLADENYHKQASASRRHHEFDQRIGVVERGTFDFAVRSAEKRSTCRARAASSSRATARLGIV